MTSSMPKYCAMKPESELPKPWSIMRRTAVGSASVIAAAMTRKTSAPATSPL